MLLMSTCGRCCRPLVQQEQVTRRDSFAWSIHLVLDTAVHAYTLPGGHLVINTGLLHALPHEAACVGFLAREVALAQTGAAMAAFDRAIEDNSQLGDLMLGNPMPDLRELIKLAPTVNYTRAELSRADSLAATLVCMSDYHQEAFIEAVGHFSAQSHYLHARPAQPSWRQLFNERVQPCEGADSLYIEPYQVMLRQAVPR